jgi:hypothetical protein
MPTDTGMIVALRSDANQGFITIKRADDTEIVYRITRDYLLDLAMQAYSQGMQVSVTVDEETPTPLVTELTI